jgi:hypothetical protein
VAAETAGPAADVTLETGLPGPESWAGLADAWAPVVAGDVAVDGAADPVAPVTAEATDPTADVAAEVVPLPEPEPWAGLADEAVDVTAEVTDVAADVGESAACACFDSPSKTATMPTVKIATWTARRARCRNVGWDTKELPLGRERRRDRTSHDNHP